MNIIERWEPEWPEGADCAAMLSFDIDGLLLWVDKSTTPDPRAIGRARSLGNYGPETAMPRILDMLTRNSLRATFFIPSFIVEHWPNMAQEIVARGHEIGLHGHLHEDFHALSVNEQSVLIDHSQAIFERELGVRATGFRSPAGDWGPATPKLLADKGIRYSSSTHGDDRPFRYHLDGAAWLVDIPSQFDVDDFPQFGYNDAPAKPVSQDRPASTAATFENWEWEFEGTSDEGLAWVLIMHPQVIGTPNRLAALEALIHRMRARNNVWFATGEEISQWVSESLDRVPGVREEEG